MTMRVTIIRRTKRGWKEAVPGLSIEEFLTAVLGRTAEELDNNGIKHKKEILSIIGKAYGDVIVELKQSTIKSP